VATQAQIEANRRNSSKSTGPRTPEGKQRVRLNATRHGLCSGVALMDEESELASEFALLLEDLREEHQPNGPTEDILVFKMAESFFFANRAAVFLAERLTFNKDDNDAKQVALMLRYHSTYDRAFGRHLNDLRKLQKERRNELQSEEHQNEEIGFVSSTLEPEPAAEPEFHPVPATEAPKTPAPAVQSSPQPFPKAA
jgi:hypothetical protein